ncbi:hypothetical protein ACFVXE_38520 [Streptomyces sp. NPDC058231]|uniref:hypothetical protein n=1 Tax=Streptomyces sp. NPDC058231 TaxID=3346392 RepID=UPI0036E2BE40
MHTSGRVFEGWSTWDGTEANVAFEPGPVDLREPTETECRDVLTALGVTRHTPTSGAAIASDRV